MPVVGGGDAGVQVPAAAVGRVAEPGEVGGEVQRVEIALGIGQPLMVEADFVQRDNLSTRRHQMSDIAYSFIRIECDNEKHSYFSARQIGDRLSSSS